MSARDGVAQLAHRDIVAGVLGVVTLWTAGGPVAVRGRRQQAVLAVLLCNANGAVTSDRIADMVWSHALPDDPLNTIHGLVFRLRKLLRAHRELPMSIVTDGTTYRAEIDRDLIDSFRFERLVTQARADATAAPATALARLDESLGLWRGPYLDGFDLSGDMAADAQRLDELRLHASELRLELLLALARPDEVVTAAQAMVTQHPLRERAWAALMLAHYRTGRQADALRAFQRSRGHLVDVIGIEPSAELRDLEARILAQDPTLDPAATATTVRTLPRFATNLIGRHTEVARLLDALPASRLVTLIGPGGVGKTRVAVAAADRWSTEHTASAWFIDLAGTSDGELVAATTLAQLGGDADGAIDEHAIARLLARHDDAVVLLDNAEHVIEPIARLVDRLLTLTPSTRYVVTSREALAIAGEHILPIAPLAVPPTRWHGDLATLCSYEAVQLFVDRVADGDAATDADSTAIATICRVLDGIPLALELAASHARSMPLIELAQRIGDRYRALTITSRRAVSRQRTLEAAIDWSYSLLTDDEQRAFEGVSVFAGGFDIRLAELVIADHEHARAGVADVLARLAEKSLLIFDRSSSRYRLLEPLRQFAELRLAERGDTLACARRHLNAMVVDAEDAARHWYGPDGGRWIERLETNHHNLTAALTFALRSADAEAALRLCAALGHWWDARGYHAEADVLAAAALALAGGAGADRAGAELAASTIAGRRGDTSRARHHATDALGRLTAPEHIERRAEALIRLAGVARREECYDEARALCAQVFALGPQAARAQPFATLMLGHIAQATGDRQSALDQLRAALDTFEHAGEQADIARALNHLAVVALDEGDLPEAAALLRRALDQFPEMLDAPGLLSAITVAATILERRHSDIAADLTLAARRYNDDADVSLAALDHASASSLRTVSVSAPESDTAAATQRLLAAAELARQALAMHCDPE